ncbi:MAG: NADH-quinone oxidoreductase subunit B family protein [Promethearchaeota archaeon]
MKPRFIIASLTSCTGCISSLISLEIFPQFLERTKIMYFPFISDSENVLDCDIALLEGCVSSEAQITLLRQVRKHAKIVCALGTCACFGGILSLSQLATAEPISNYIEVDNNIPGCPPPSKLFGNSLIRLIENKEIILSEKNMCANCPLRGIMEIDLQILISKINPNPEDIVISGENSECFLKKGILCLGPITRDGCEYKCIRMGLPCEGCMGSVSRDFTSNIINFLSLIKPSQDLKDYPGIFYRFSKPKLKW